MSGASAGGSGLGEADRVLLMALQAWAPVGRAPTDPALFPHARLLERLEPSWARRLRDGLAGETSGAIDRAEARRRLGESHGSEARVDPARVDPSWWARALREESPSVRRAVVAAAPEAIRGRVQAELLLDNEDLRAERPADPEVLAWARSLWSERLVGGEPRKADDPPIIVVMSDRSPRACYRLCRHAGEIKRALTGQAAPEWATAFAATAGPEFAVIARHDVNSTAPSRLPPRRLPARIGLLTIARLLADCEPFRVRWALQHWPYSIAKLVRALMPPAEKRSSVMLQVVSVILEAAEARLTGQSTTATRSDES